MRTPRILQSVLLVMLLISQLVLASIDPAIAAQPASTNQAIVQSALQAATSDCQTGKGFGLNAANQSLLNQLQNATAGKATIVCHDLTGKVRF